MGRLSVLQEERVLAMGGECLLIMWMHLTLLKGKVANFAMCILPQLKKENKAGEKLSPFPCSLSLRLS